MLVQEQHSQPQEHVQRTLLLRVIKQLNTNIRILLTIAGRIVSSWTLQDRIRLQCQQAPVAVYE